MIGVVFGIILISMVFPNIAFASSNSVHIVLNEILANPEGGGSEPEEFVEIFNTGEGDIDISGWKLADKVKEFVFPEGTLIKGKGFVVFKRETTKIALNNSGEEVVYLKNNKGEGIDQYELNNVKEEQVFGRFPDGGKWYELVGKTPGERNNSPVSSPTFTPSPTLHPTKTPKPTISKKPTPTFKAAKKISPTSQHVKNNIKINVFSPENYKGESSKPINDRLDITVVNERPTVVLGTFSGEVKNSTKESFLKPREEDSFNAESLKRFSNKKKSGIMFILTAGLLLSAAILIIRKSTQL